MRENTDMIKQTNWITSAVMVAVMSASPLHCFLSTIKLPPPRSTSGFNCHRRIVRHHPFRRRHHHHHDIQQHYSRGSLSLLQMSHDHNNNDNNGNSVRRNLSLPLFYWIPPTANINHNEQQIQEDSNLIYPLPSAHLPHADLRSLHVYAIPTSMFRDSYIHRKLFDDVFLADDSGTLASFSPEFSTDVSFSGTVDSKEFHNHDSGNIDQKNLYGHVVWKNVSSSSSSVTSTSSSVPSFESSSSWIGAIGCAAQILLKLPMMTTAAATDNNNNVAFPNPWTNQNHKVRGNRKEISNDDNQEEESCFICRGSFRFVVRDIIQTFPYPVALVDELCDDDIDLDNDDSNGIPTNLAIATPSSFADHEDDDDEEENDDDTADIYQSMKGPQLVQRIFIGLQTLVNRKVEERQRNSATEMSPLEAAILSDSGMEPTASSSSSSSLMAEEMAAVWDVFREYVIDELITTARPTRDYFYTVAMMAAEMAHVSNHLRAKIIVMTNGIERLRVILRTLDETIGMSRARSLAKDITTQTDEASKDLKVGDPQLPSWSRQIQKGTRISYYWNDDYGWCNGEVLENPLRIVDELVVTVRFDDGEIHRLPFAADEKVRWKPLSNQ